MSRCLTRNSLTHLKTYSYSSTRSFIARSNLYTFKQGLKSPSKVIDTTPSSTSYSIRRYTEMSGMNSSGNNPPVWLHRDDLLSPSVSPAYPKLTQDIEADVTVVGGGIAGLHIAYELLDAGIKNVVVLEDGKIGSGETGRTTGHLSVDNEYNEFLNIHGPEMTADVAAAQQAAIERIASIVNRHKIDCDFERIPGYMFQGQPSSSPDHDESIVKEVYKAAEGTHKLDLEMVDDATIPGFSSGRAIRFNNQATFHPTKYIRRLAEVITDMGGKIYESTHVMEFNEENGVTVAKTDDGRSVRAKQLVMATNVPMQKLMIIDRIEAFRTYAVAFKIPNSAISTSHKSALWWDMADPYHYIRVTPHKDEGYSLLVVGGEDDKVGQHDDYDERYQRLVEWTKERWAEVGAVEYKWSGQVMESDDGIAHIGLNPGTKNIYIHTGDNGDGLTYAAVGGMILRDLILGKTHPWAYTFSPSRQHSPSHLDRALKVLPDYLKENITDQIHYAKWITTATKSITDIEDLVPGQGDVVREGIHPVAVYKDENGEVHKMTAVCPHLKGIVVWNKDEKSFDCPIHGSRFTCKGAVVNGPAKGPLQAR